MSTLDVIIPARQEMFLTRTVENVLANIRGDTRVIVVCDGNWPDPPIQDHPRVNVLHYSVPIGQRQATNAGARVSQAKYIMKLDAHCAVAEGFDVQLCSDGEKLGKFTTQIPRMYNLHGFDWVCANGHRRYQSPSGPCTDCGAETKREILWQPRWNRRTDHARFDKTLHFQYWKDANRHRGKDEEISDLLCAVGACWFLDRERYWELGGMDERHGSWGQMGVEVACKAWLSGGRQVVNKRTWFSHLFRTQGKDFGFPYEVSWHDQEKAREHSRWLWLGDNWEQAVRPLAWLVDRFKPVPEWHGCS